MKKLLFGMVVFLAILTSCSSKQEITESDLDKIQLGDTTSALTEKYGEPDTTIDGDAARKKLVIYQDILKDSEPVESDAITSDVLEKALDASEDAYQDDYLELWEYNYKNKDGNKETFNVFVNNDKVIYLPNINSYK